MLKEDIIDFFQRIPPFHYLTSVELTLVSNNVFMDYYPAGTVILEHNGPPSEFLYVIKKGGVKVYLVSDDEGETIIDYRGEGELFGMLSLINSDHSRFNIGAVEDTICYLISKENVQQIMKNNARVNEYFLKSFFLNFFNKTFDEAHKKYSGIAVERLLFSLPVGEIIRSSPITASEDISIQRGAAIMSQHKISSLIIVNDKGHPVGMVTDRDLREKVVADGLDVEKSLSFIMSSTLITVESDEYCFEALMKMMRYKIHHIIVMNNGELQGMITNHDLMVLQGTSPTMMVKEIGKVDSLDILREWSSGIHHSVASLLRDGAKAHNICGLITELTENIINAIFDFIKNQIGPAPVPYSVFIFGAGGRRELSLDFRVELGLVYRDENDQQHEETKDYFSLLQKKINDSLSLCLSLEQFSIKQDHIKSLSEWLASIAVPVDDKAAQLILDFFEIRTIQGSEQEGVMLRRKITELALKSETTFSLLAAATVGNRPPLGFFKQFVVEKNGEHKDNVDIFAKGIKPLVDIVRIFAIAEGCQETSTKRRLIFLKKIKHDLVTDIENALDYLWDVLINKQLEQKKEGREADSFINPERLSNFDRKTLKEVFTLIRSLYTKIEDKHRIHHQF